MDEYADENLKDLDENLAWLTQKTEDPKGIKGVLLSPLSHTVNVTELNCKIIKKVAIPPFLHQTPPPLSSKKFRTLPQVTQFLESPTSPPTPLPHPPSLIRRRFQLC